ncbi:DEAD/DEAH box helicase family protein [Coraliomargarita sp. SDUM461003]|uniref:DEAD/DEAH box helicase family protein n=1 Tax=Thalassobacterium maritimum TaxID=3041265 RepID=A0ABU1AWF1_9BACT|nr:DEAD/DEAH box helicase family protein [Coraliomargarita sp. SDUM461003]MDQ8207470.1 DEAD/DEAH box helicase family protein [Coraliomargarita sp. SDUM461003]
MPTFPPTLCFAHPWRDYQARALAEMEAHLDDARLHVVAPPGSGKTVLGLEFMRRLAGPSLVVAPTRTIQSQWAERLRQDFAAGAADWISLDLRQPGLVTITTYQMVDQVMSQPGAEPVLAALRALGVQTLLLDEAHHLKQAWWQSIIDLRKRIEGVHTISLTATPPYDSSAAEWERYIQLCGEIDMEIPVPELVLNGDLCPHVDLLYFEFASPEDLQQRASFQSQINELVADLLHRDSLAEQINKHPWLLDPEAHEVDIYAEVEWFSSLLIYLHTRGARLQPELLELLDAEAGELPCFDTEWAQVLLRGIVSKKQRSLWPQDFVRQIEALLKQRGAIERGHVHLLPSHARNRRLMRSATKLRSIEAIVRVERETHGADLRLLVLSDYIYPEFLGTYCERSRNAKSLKLGAVPIFERLRQLGDERVGLLTGSMVIIPASAAGTLLEVCRERGLSPADVRLEVLEALPDYRALTLLRGASRQLVPVMTETFARGAIHILSGTQALLGEGWDAPCINSLIIASNVGSFVSSNQIRGRAIRTNPSSPLKVSKIWHLVTLTGVPHDEPDLDCVRRRLKTFVGPNHREAAIQSGYERLGIPASILTPQQCEQVNDEMQALSANASWIRQAWLGPANAPDWKGLFYRSIQVKGRKLMHYAYLWRTVEAVLYGAALSILGVGFDAFRHMLSGGRGLAVWGMLLLMLLIGLLRIAPDLWRALRLYRQYGLTGVTADRVGRSLFRTMHALGKFDEDVPEQALTVDRFMGQVSVSLKGGNRMDRHHFATAFLEMMGPIRSPHYLISSVTSARSSYFPVPELLRGSEAERTELLRQAKRLMGNVRLVHCRSREGRRVLLQARACSIFNEWEDAGESLSRWE